MPSEDKLRDVLEEIRTATYTGKLNWAETAKDDEYLALFRNGKYHLKALPFSDVDHNEEMVGPPSLSLYRSEDDTLLFTIRAGSGGASANQLKALFSDIRDRALGIDQAIDDVLGELKAWNDDIPF